jgi:hypothetical protein
MEEELHRLTDEKTWSDSHLQQVISHNVKSVAFWVLLTGTLCFACLNSYYGFSSTRLGENVLVSAIAIGILYFAMELTIPVSAHMLSWGAKGESRWLVRIAGAVAFGLGVSFSLLILQSKFSTGADTTAARSEARAAVASSDRSALAIAQKKVLDLTSRVGAKSEGQFQSEMAALLSTMVTRKENLGDRTDGCRGQQRSSNERDLCQKYNALSTGREEASALAQANADVNRLTGNMMNSNRSSVRTANAQDVVLAKILGTTPETVTMFKASIIAAIAALIIHMLWGAHGFMVNAAIKDERNAMLGRAKLERAVGRAKEVAQRSVLETVAQFQSAQSGIAIAHTLTNAPLREQPMAMQIHKYFTVRTNMGPAFSQQLGLVHDDYVMWCRDNQITHATVDRFGAMVKEIGVSANITVSHDGRVVGAALRQR